MVFGDFFDPFGGFVALVVSFGFWVGVDIGYILVSGGVGLGAVVGGWVR